MIACRSPPAFLPPSIGVSDPSGYGPLSLSLAYVKWIRTLACDPATVVYGIPYGNPPGALGREGPECVPGGSQVAPRARLLPARRGVGRRVRGEGRQHDRTEHCHPPPSNACSLHAGSMRTHVRVVKCEPNTCLNRLRG